MADSIFSSLARSNLPYGEKKSALRQWVDGMKGAGLSRVKTHAIVAGHAVRQVGESVIVGGALALAHVELPDGLDAKINLGNGHVAHVPIDGLTAVAATVGGIALAGEEISTDLRNSGAAASSIFAFRKLFDLFAEKKRARGQTPGGKFAGELDQGSADASSPDADPIVEVARTL